MFFCGLLFFCGWSLGFLCSFTSTVFLSNDGFDDDDGLNGRTDGGVDGDVFILLLGGFFF